MTEESAPAPGQWRLELRQIAPPPAVEKKPDTRTLMEEAALARFAAETESFQQDTDERKKYAARIYWLLCIWLVGLFALLFCRGFAFMRFELSDKVLITIITGTTANILGIFAIVVKYLFPKTAGQLPNWSPPYLIEKPPVLARKRAKPS